MMNVFDIFCLHRGKYSLGLDRGSNDLRQVNFILTENIKIVWRDEIFLIDVTEKAAIMIEKNIMVTRSILRC